jgi:anti-sigma factor RsiW
MDGHDQRNHQAGDGLSCPDCCLELQDYLDGTLEKKRSLSVFLHLRECEACRVEHDALRAVFAGLEALPALEAPADFDARVLASVPYGAYQAMASLRRERVPVFLEEQFLPAWLRARATRLVGLVVTAAVATAFAAGVGPGWLLAPGVAGLVPELLCRMQSAGRRLVGLRRAEG